jgi:hypothetical protein
MREPGLRVGPAGGERARPGEAAVQAGELPRHGPLERDGEQSGAQRACKTLDGADRAGGRGDVRALDGRNAAAIDGVIVAPSPAPNHRYRSLLIPNP